MKIEKEILINFSSLGLRHLKNVNCHFWLGYNIAHDGRLGKAGLVRQYMIAGFAASLFLSCFSCTEEENCVDEIMTENGEWSQ